MKLTVNNVLGALAVALVATFVVVTLIGVFFNNYNPTGAKNHEAPAVRLLLNENSENP